MIFADVILPLALPHRTYTYAVPDEFKEVIAPGQRVEAPFGKSKLYSGIVEKVHQTAPSYRVKDIISIIDEVAFLRPEHLQFWDWMARYYCCTMGEILLAALPGNMKLGSETTLLLNADTEHDMTELSADEYLIAEALMLQNEITIEDARKILNKKTILPVIQKLIHRGILMIREELQEKYKPRKIMAVRWADPWRSEPDRVGEVFELVKSEPQHQVLLALIQLLRQQVWVGKKELIRAAGTSESPLTSLVKQEILEVYEREVGRMPTYQDTLHAPGGLSPAQSAALSGIHQHFSAGKKVVLLKGITGSGKTQVYIQMIQETLLQGGQVLYLLPEIALTTQIVERMRRVFGGDIAIFHSKVNANERVEVWRKAATGQPVILAPRSGLFLPFSNLQLIIVDEEHDPAYKQYDPAPRYHARDTAIYLAHQSGANVVLGTATPSVETWHNAITGKYGLVTLDERYGGVELPELQLTDLRQQLMKRTMHGAVLGAPLYEAIKNALDQREQVILFQNRRGYAPILQCQVCAWNSMCRHCDVSLTYHKYYHKLRCHYCNYQADVPETCPACGSAKLTMLGAGTEKIEDELQVLFPAARIARMDMDTAGTRSGLNHLLNDFEEREIDILVGTQMVAKGLDFENVALVGVINADQMLRFPDFRSGERAFQLITQASGRAGRRAKRGSVIIQAYNPEHPVLKEIMAGSYEAFAERELKERQEFRYPPFVRLIQVTIQHKEDKTAAAAAGWVAASVRDKLGAERVSGPTLPVVPRVRNYYQQVILIKMEKNNDLLVHAKQLLGHIKEQLTVRQGWSQVKMVIDVDPT